MDQTLPGTPPQPQPASTAPTPIPTPGAYQVPPSAVSAPPAAPTSWPGAFGVYKHSKQAVTVNIGLLIVFWLIFIAISIVLDMALKPYGSILAIILEGLMLAATVLLLIEGVRGHHVSFGNILGKAVGLWLKMIGLYILVGLTTVLSILLLIIPFFFVYPRLVLAFYFLADKNMGVIEAYKASWNNTKGHIGKVWGIIGASIAMALLSITIIGIPFSIYFLIMYSAAFAVLYEFINTASGTPAQAATPTSTAAPAPPSSFVPPQTPNTPVPPLVNS